MSELLLAKGTAPGRIDFLGGVADYSGAWVLEIPIQAEVVVSIFEGQTEGWEFDSSQEGKFVLPLPVLREFEAASKNGLSEAAKVLREAKTPLWGFYPLGSVASLLHHEKWKKPLPASLRFSLDSQVPSGMGVSSSAALEVATLSAFSNLGQIEWSGTELARLAQRGENEVVGAPCGLMDQLTAAYGKRNALLPILCRPDQLEAPVPLPEGIAIVGWPSGVRHNVGASPYSTARCGAFMAKKMLESNLHRSLVHLSEIRVSELAKLSRLLPETMSGTDFVFRYQGHDDRLTAFPAPGRNRPEDAEKLERIYPVRPAGSFPIEETHRTLLAIQLFQNMAGNAGSSAARRVTLELIGELMLQSHEGYNRMGLGSAETDAMVKALVRLGPGQGIFGARISGGGSGGTVVVLLEETAIPRLDRLRLEMKTPHPLILG